MDRGVHIVPCSVRAPRSYLVALRAASLRAAVDEPLGFGFSTSPSSSQHLGLGVLLSFKAVAALVFLSAEEAKSLTSSADTGRLSGRDAVARPYCAASCTGASHDAKRRNWPVQDKWNGAMPTWKQGSHHVFTKLSSFLAQTHVSYRNSLGSGAVKMELYEY
eukprot:3289513-Amphidinium_carterae.1